MNEKSFFIFYETSNQRNKLNAIGIFNFQG